MNGSVSGTLTPYVQVIVRGPLGDELPINFLLDTGYNGYISLHSRTIGALSLVQIGSEPLTFANGSNAPAEMYEAVLIWDGQERNVVVHQLDDDPLLGTLMLFDHDVNIGFVYGGPVTVQRRP